jgi:NADH:ubiquinone oxidoreductase subunit C
MPAPDVVEALRVRYEAAPFALGVVVAAEHLADVMRTLRDRFGYRYYVLASATDRGEIFDVVHGVRNLDTRDELFVKVRLARDRAALDSLAFLYSGAEWHEREILDLFGIVFRNHPDPRRILLPDEYEGHPLRKDFPMDAPWGFRPATREPGA